MRIPSYLYTKKYSGVYCIENSVNNKRYIGSSNSLYQRLHKHSSLLNHNKHQNPYLQNAWNKYNGDNFECYVLEFCSEELLTITEQKWIDELKSEYNLTKEVVRNVLSQESRDKISETLKKGYADGSIALTRTRKVKAYDLNGNFVKQFDTLRDASRELNTHLSSIIRVLRGTYMQANNYQFRYAEDESEVGKVEESRYRRRFYHAPIKLGELLETPEEDNQQPSANLKD